MIRLHIEGVCVCVCVCVSVKTCEGLVYFNELFARFLPLFQIVCVCVCQGGGMHAVCTNPMESGAATTEEAIDSDI